MTVPLQPGVFAKTFPGSEPEAVLTQVAAAGFEAVQWNMACAGLEAMPEAIPGDVTQAIAAAAARHGITLSAVSGTFNMIHPDRGVREDGLRRLAVLAEAAPKMGTGLITLCTGTRDPADKWRHHPDNASEAAWSDLLESMRTAVAIAESHDIALGVEPELANVVSTPAKARDLIETLGSERVQIVLDPANLFETAAPDEQRALVEDAIDRLGRHITLTHAKDRASDGTTTAAGSGVIDFAHFARRMVAAGYRGAWIAHDLRADEAGRVCDFLRATLHEAA